MQIFQNFGVNPILLIAQIFNFLVILVILKKFLYKPVLKMLDQREKDAKKAIEDAALAEQKLEEADARETEILQKAQEKAEKIITDAKLQATQLVATAEEDAKVTSERLLLEARAKIAQETAEAEERLTKNIGRIAIALLEKSLTGIFNSKEQKTILKKAEIQLQKRT